MGNQLLRNIPKMDVLLQTHMPKYQDVLSHDLLKVILEKEISDIRQGILSGDIKAFDESVLNHRIEMAVAKYTEPSFKRVINATGIILHTNLGRAVLSEKMIDAIKPSLCHYNTLEYDVALGRRGSRYAHVEDKIKLLTGAEAALVVNNNAAAVMLVLSTLAKGKEVVVSRGELVEIGGAFRVPDVMTSSGCVLKEIGTTNKTHLRDYENAIGDATAMLMKVHTSNYKIVGFTQSVEAEDLVEVGRAHQLPVYEDLGSGLMVPLNGADEPVVKHKVREGIDVLSFSGDKLFGGAQCGIIIGKKAYIEPMKKNPLLRAFRMDKMTLAVLEQSLIWYLKDENAFENIPTLNMIDHQAEAVKEKVEAFMAQYGEKFASKGLKFNIVETLSEVGGGSLPDVQKPVYGLSFSELRNLSRLQDQLRQLPVPIISMVQNECLVLNFATIFEDDYELLANGLWAVLCGGVQ